MRPNDSHVVPINARRRPEATVSTPGPAAGFEDGYVTALANGSIDRSQRVEQLRVQYQSGKYKVDATELSTRMVNRHLTNE